MLVYFGYPAAHEDDAARSIRAGLEIVTALDQARSQFPQPVQVRIGIHTGPVVVGQMGGGSRHEQLALGETPNIAARVQGKAHPDQVVISAATQRLVAGLFDMEDQGRHELKGISTRQPLYHVIAENVVQNRFDVAVQTGLTPLAGREHELGVLCERWSAAQAGEGQVVLLSGEPGIGKSRLVQELKDRTTQDDATQIAFQCSPYHQNSALSPLIVHVERLLQFAPEDTPQTKLEKLQRTLGRYRFPQPDTVPLFAALLSLPQPEGIPSLTISPEKQKELTQAALVAWLLEEAAQQPVYNTWEDLHWADPSTLEVLGLLLTQVPTTRLLAVLTFRPEFIPPWGTLSYLSQLTLRRLDQAHVNVMVERVTGGKSLPEEVVQQIVTKTDGVPLFVEELTKMVVESGIVHAVNNHYELSGPVADLAIPSTLQDSLMARLDRLPTAKEVAQLGATIGREFSYELLQAVSSGEEMTLRQGLGQLVDAELIYQRGLPPQAVYLFKHALIQDTAYLSLLKRSRQQYHQQIAQVLVEQFSVMVETQPELVARHYTEAGLTAQAIPYWQRAGKRAIQRSAFAEAVSQLTQALALLQTLPDSPERNQQEFFLQASLGQALAASKGFSASEVEHAYARALELGRCVGETPQLFPVLGGLWLFYHGRREFQTTGRELAEQMMRLAQHLQDPALLLAAHVYLGLNLFWGGEFAATRTVLEQGLSFSDPQQPAMSHLREFCLLYGSFAVWHLGYPDHARKMCQEALASAEARAHPYEWVVVLDNAALLYLLCRDWQRARELAEAAMTLSTEQGFPYWAAWGIIQRGWALAEMGQMEDGIAQMQEGLATFRAIGAELPRIRLLPYLAAGYAKAGQVEAGLSVLPEARTLGCDPQK